MSERERIGLLTLVSVVVVFGVHSLVDWTWFIPANAALALLAAGWVAGRGGGPPPVRVAPATGLRRIAPARLAWAAGVVVLAAVLAWAIYQPLRAVEAGDRAIARADRGDYAGAARAARRGHELNPLAVEPLWELAVMEHARDNRRGAAAALEKAVRLQPARAEAWTRLGRYRLSAEGDAQGGLDAFRAAASLDPASPTTASDVVEAYRAVQAERGATP
jgi:cytochrome c-type biogenesis protein CcmH/NrfG